MQTATAEEIVRILPKGIMTIPKKMRTSVGLAENGLARVREEKGRLIIEPIYTLPYPVRQYTDKEIEEFFALDDKETNRLKRRGLLP